MDASNLQSFVVEFLQKLGVEAESVVVSTGHRTVVAITTASPDALLGPDGEHLRALNSIAKRMVEKAHGEDASAFLIDVNGHHESQMEHVRQEARVLAQRARLFKHDVEMPPLSSYERLVVHELFANDEDIKTESAGEGKFRHIVLKYKGSDPSPKNP
jgi:spoIIIJ-associated protein